MVTGRVPLADDDEPRPDLAAVLQERGIEAIVVKSEGDLDLLMTDSLPHIVLLDISFIRKSEVEEIVEKCSRLKLPVLALVPRARIDEMDVAPEVDDFVVSPSNVNELVARASRVIRRTESPDDGDVIRVGELVINPANYEVSVKGRRVNLRFKEYELLRLLASSPGRVFTRESLLNHVWGYDYFGGTRTVDVHIRRLRSKIEDAEHSFIETIWNVGYRFRDVRRFS
jgi:DNA-binding response OmpR family regulator